MVDLATNGIVICPKCRAKLIAEEVEAHRHTETYRIEGDTLWVRWFDGKWYRHELPREVKRPFRPRGDEIEPKPAFAKRK
jgi:hypothetical protein